MILAISSMVSPWYVVGYAAHYTEERQFNVCPVRALVFGESNNKTCEMFAAHPLMTHGILTTGKLKNDLKF